MTVEQASISRTKNYTKQLKGGVLFKGVAVVLNYFTLPLIVSCIGLEEFGVWSTLVTIVSWVLFFDLGIGNGLKNEVSKLLAVNKMTNVSDAVSSAYGLSAFLIGLCSIFFVMLSFLVPWQSVFNSPNINETYLRNVVQISVVFMSLNFVLGLVISLLSAMQKMSVAYFGQMLSAVFIFISLLVLSGTGSGTLRAIAFTYGVSLSLVYILLTTWIFKNLPFLRPRLYFSLSGAWPLLNVGLKFFFIQLAALVVFATDKILIAQFFGPAEVARYDVIFKLLSLVSFVHLLVLGPLWSSYTDAFARGDSVWISSMLRRQIYLFFLLMIVLVLLVLLSSHIISLWMGEQFVVSYPLVWSIGIFVAVSSWNNVYATLLNGLGDTRLQIYTASFALISNIPLSFFFVKVLGYGASGVVLAAALSLACSAMFLPLQVAKIIKSILPSVDLKGS